MASMSATEPKYHLVGFHTRYSSWTARVETVLKYFDLDHTASFHNVKGTGKSVSASGFVPILYAKHLSKNIPIHDSLAILEFLAEDNPSLSLWPEHPLLRALTRSAVAEIHSGFSVVRGTYHTNFLAKYTGKIPVTSEAKEEIDRLLKIWDELRKLTMETLGERDQGYLGGNFGIVDSFFWPVLWRFRTYNLPLDSATPEALAWMKKMWNDPKMKEISKDYFEQAKRPETKVERYDDIFKGNPEIEFGFFGEDWNFSA